MSARNNPDITYIKNIVIFINNKKPRTITGTFKSSKSSPKDEKKIQICPAAKPRGVRYQKTRSRRTILNGMNLSSRFSCTKSKYKKNSEAGNDLLSREANRSTIGAGGLNFRVRHGTGWTPSAILTCFHCSIKTDKTVSASSLSSSTSSFQASHLLQDSFNSTNLKQVKASTL